MHYHTERICAECIETATRLYELKKTQANIRSKKHYTRKHWRQAIGGGSIEKMFAKIEMYDNTLHDLTLTGRMIRRDHDEHMKESS